MKTLAEFCPPELTMGFFSLLYSISGAVRAFTFGAGILFVRVQVSHIESMDGKATALSWERRAYLMGSTLWRVAATGAVKGFVCLSRTLRLFTRSRQKRRAYIKSTHQVADLMRGRVSFERLSK